MSSTVNRPTVTAQKEADINRKLQIYGIYSAFQQGKVPSVCFPENFLRPPGFPAIANVNVNRRTTRSMSH